MERHVLALRRSISRFQSGTLPTHSACEHYTRCNSANHKSRAKIHPQYMGWALVFRCFLSIDWTVHTNKFKPVTGFTGYTAFHPSVGINFFTWRQARAWSLLKTVGVVCFPSSLVPTSTTDHSSFQPVLLSKSIHLLFRFSLVRCLFETWWSTAF